MVKQNGEVVQEDNNVKKLAEAGKKKSNRGQLIVDATCIPGDIKYPSDLGLLSTARVKTEKMIDSPGGDATRTALPDKSTTGSSQAQNRSKPGEKRIPESLVQRHINLATDLGLLYKEKEKQLSNNH